MKIRILKRSNRHSKTFGCVSKPDHFANWGSTGQHAKMSSSSEEDVSTIVKGKAFLKHLKEKEIEKEKVVVIEEKKKEESITERKLDLLSKCTDAITTPAKPTTITPPIKKPSNCGSYYYNYKHTHSIILSAITGPEYECLYADVGSNGRVNDSGVWNNSL